jgi:hypothetical protein
MPFLAAKQQKNKNNIKDCAAQTPTATNHKQQTTGTNNEQLRQSKKYQINKGRHTPSSVRVRERKRRRTRTKERRTKERKNRASQPPRGDKPQTTATNNK